MRSSSLSPEPFSALVGEEGFAPNGGGAKLYMRRSDVGESWPWAIKDVLIGPIGAGAKGGPVSMSDIIKQRKGNKLTIGSRRKRTRVSIARVADAWVNETVVHLNILA